MARPFLRGHSRSNGFSLMRCYHCDSDHDVMSFDRLSHDAAFSARVSGVVFPACVPCINAKYQGRSLSKDVPAISILRRRTHAFDCVVLKRLKNGGLAEGRKMAFEIEQHWAIFKVLWDLVTLDLDQLERLSERVRKVRIAEIQRTISKLNDVHRWLTSASYKLSSRFAIDYAKMRKEANAEVRKQWVRDSIMAEYGFRCAGCGSTDRLTIDHIVPVARGGSSERGNLQVLCFTCNCKKGYSAPPRVTVT